MKFLEYLSIKRYLPRSLFARSLLILTVPIVLTLIISTYVFFDRHWERMVGRLAVAVAGEVAFLAEQVKENKNPKVMSRLQEDSMSHLQLNLRYVEDGVIQPDPVDYRGRGDIIKKALSRELKEKLQYPYRIIVDVGEKWIQIHVQLEDGLLIVTSPERRLFSSSGFVFLIWMIGVSSVLLIVAILFMRNQIRPIKRLSIAAERFGTGRDVAFFKLEGAKEVRQAAKAFLGMRERINKQIQQRTAMLAGVSHDLRTPLTRMKLQAEMMGDSEDVQALKSDIHDMERMMNAYLQFAKGEGNELSERVDILDMLNRLAATFSRDGMPVEVTSSEKTFDMFVRPVAFERCLSNIIANAQKYADAAWIGLIADDDHVTLIIEDNGPGIEEDFYEDVFKPFFREEKSRNSKTGGVGLGLPIAQDIVLAHGGDISLHRSEHGGLKVKIELPV